MLLAQFEYEFIDWQRTKFFEEILIAGQIEYGSVFIGFLVSAKFDELISVTIPQLMVNANQVIGMRVSVKTSILNTVTDIAIETLLAEDIVEKKTINAAIFDDHRSHETDYR